MVRSGSKRKRPRVLNFDQRYMVAVQLMNGQRPKIIAADWEITVSYVSKIKSEFLEEILVWKPNVLSPLQGSLLEGLEALAATPLPPWMK